MITSVVGSKKDGTPFGEIWIRSGKATPFPFGAESFDENTAALLATELTKRGSEKWYTEPTEIMRNRMAKIGKDIAAKGAAT